MPQRSVSERGLDFRHHWRVAPTAADVTVASVTSAFTASAAASATAALQQLFALHL